MWIKEKYIDVDGQELKVLKVSDFDKDYFNLHGKLHRLDGPAVEYPNKNYEWHKDGKLHRIGGPAYFISGIMEWYINGRYVRNYYICG